MRNDTSADLRARSSTGLTVTQPAGSPDPVRSNEKGALDLGAVRARRIEGVSAARCMDVTSSIREKPADAGGSREEIVPAPLRPQRGRPLLAEQVGIGPTTLTDDRRKLEEKNLYTRFNIVIALLPHPCKRALRHPVYATRDQARRYLFEQATKTDDLGTPSPSTTLWPFNRPRRPHR